MGAPSIPSITREVHRCVSCTRLRKHCLEVAREKRRAYVDQEYWGKPIAGFGDPKARLLVVGLAPAAHGANRTGRVFTGDRSGDWLYRALHRAGFANQALCRDRDDGLELRDAYVTCVVKCAPPDNKPLPDEIQSCAPHLANELRALDRIQVVLALGQIALNGIWPFLGKNGPKQKFTHGAEAELSDNRRLLMSYHPSQQNTFTGRLTEPMFDSVFHRARALISG